MDWTAILQEVLELLVYPVITIGGVYLTYLISVKIKGLKQELNDETADKYLDMLNNTISNAVLATTQTYVEALKKAGKFDEEAQKQAFQMTYDAIMKVLTDEARLYITEVVGDLDAYVTMKIESNVQVTKVQV